MPKVDKSPSTPLTKAFAQLRRDFNRFLQFGQSDKPRSEVRKLADSFRIQIRSLWKRMGSKGNSPINKKLLAMADMLAQHASAIAKPSIDSPSGALTAEDTAHLRETFEFIQAAATLLEQFDKMPKDEFPDLANRFPLESLLGGEFVQEQIDKRDKSIVEFEDAIKKARQELDDKNFSGIKTEDTTAYKVSVVLKEIAKISTLSMHVAALAIMTLVVMPLCIAAGTAMTTLLVLPASFCLLFGEDKAAEDMAYYSLGFFGFGSNYSEKYGLSRVAEACANVAEEIKEEFIESTEEIQSAMSGRSSQHDIELFSSKIQPHIALLNQHKSAKKFLETLKPLVEKVKTASINIRDNIALVDYAFRGDNRKELIDALNKPEQGISFFARHWKLGAKILGSIVIVAATIALLPYILPAIEAAAITAGLSGSISIPSLLGLEGMQFLSGLIMGATSFGFMHIGDKEIARKKQYANYLNHFTEHMDDVLQTLNIAQKTDNTAQAEVPIEAPKVATAPAEEVTTDTGEVVIDPLGSLILSETEVTVSKAKVTLLKAFNRFDKKVSIEEAKTITGKLSQDQLSELVIELVLSPEMLANQPLQYVLDKYTIPEETILDAKKRASAAGKTEMVEILDAKIKTER